MLKKRWIATFVALLILVAGWFAGVQLALAESGEQLADKYATLAGSEANAKVLVKGLRDGSDFAIGGTKFDPPTHKMGNGEVNIALTAPYMHDGRAATLADAVRHHSQTELTAGESEDLIAFLQSLTETSQLK